MEFELYCFYLSVFFWWSGTFLGRFRELLSFCLIRTNHDDNFRSSSKKTSKSGWLLFPVRESCSCKRFPEITCVQVDTSRNRLSTLYRPLLIHPAEIHLFAGVTDLLLEIQNANGFRVSNAIFRGGGRPVFLTSSRTG